MTSHDKSPVLSAAATRPAKTVASAPGYRALDIYRPLEPALCKGERASAWATVGQALSLKLMRMPGGASHTSTCKPPPAWALQDCLQRNN